MHWSRTYISNCFLFTPVVDLLLMMYIHVLSRLRYFQNLRSYANRSELGPTNRPQPKVIEQ